MRLGSLFTGVAGLDRAAAEVFNAELAWVADNDPASARLLAHHYPDAPNHGDITRVGLPYSDEEWTAMCARAKNDPEYELPLPDWSKVEPVELLLGGFPCQDISVAGRQAGMRPGTRSGLWSHMAYAISQLQPRLVVIENVDALRSTAAHSDVERCPWCMGDEEDEPALRALGAVLADLAALGFNAEWTSVPAAGVGACHLRWRVFIVAYPAGDGRDEGRPESAGFVGGSDVALGGGATAADPDREYRGERGLAASGQAACRWSQRELAGRGRAGAATDTDGAGLEGAEPAPGFELSAGRTPADTDGGRRGPSELDHDARESDPAGCGDWGVCEPAIRRWARILGRPAPVPTVTGARGGRKLNPALPEWMMGFPEGWITDVPGISVNDALRLTGNAVCEQQAVAALRWLLPLIELERAA